MPVGTRLRQGYGETGIGVPGGEIPWQKRIAAEREL